MTKLVKVFNVNSDVLGVANRPLSQPYSWYQVGTAPFEISTVRIQREKEVEIEVEIEMKLQISIL